MPGSEANLEFTQTFESNYDGAFEKTFDLGGSWQPSLPVEEEGEGSTWTRLIERHEPAVKAVEEEGEIVEPEIPAANWIELIDNEGGAIQFEEVGGSYVSPPEAKELKLTKEGETFVLANAANVKTTFKSETSVAGEYVPKSTIWQANSKSAQMVYSLVNGKRRLTMEIAPAAEGVTCTEAEATKTKGCRALTFQYKSRSELGTCTGSEGECRESRLATIIYYNASGNESTSKTVAEYGYSPAGYLSEEWDPEISPALKEKYSYGTYGELESLTPAGEEPWNLAYYPIENSLQRLKSISRATLLSSPSTATTTIDYHVPISGSGAPTT